ncbi:YdcF family protein [Rhodanobacter sp. Col0626]|uniref:YdcF family protein n=1 Tax=Rhodanobacter sp. Col0626 TaxID=3415679 RepID=UPI003CEF7B37
MAVDVNLLIQLSAPQQPLMQTLGLGVLGLWLQQRKHRRAAYFCLVLGIGWIGLCATPSFSDWMRHGLEGRYPQYDAQHYPVADAIVVLGGDFKIKHFAEPGCPPRIPHSERVDFGYALYRAARAPAVLLSGGDGEAQGMARQLVCDGVPISALTLETRSTSTRQNATNCKALLEDMGARRILLVTSSIHMPRASASFRSIGIDIIPAPTTEPPRSHRFTGTQWRPITTLLRSGQALKEYGGFAYYWLRGWVS